MAKRKKRKLDYLDDDPWCDYITRDEFERSEYSEYLEYDEFFERSLERLLSDRPDHRLGYF